MTGQFETYSRCLCGTVITGARFDSRFHCLACGRAWHIRSWGGAAASGRRLHGAHHPPGLHRHHRPHRGPAFTQGHLRGEIGRGGGLRHQAGIPNRKPLGAGVGQPRISASGPGEGQDSKHCHWPGDLVVDKLGEVNFKMEG